MKNKFFYVLVLCMCALVTACASDGDTATKADIPPVTESSSSSETELLSSMVDSSSVQYVPDGTITDAWETKGMFTPTPAVTTAIETYKMAEGTEMENDVYVLKGKEEGPAIYIVASVHGDEIAGYNAANKLKNMELKKGTLYILSPANVIGAEKNTRFVCENGDLNRSFPGNPNGNQAEQLADFIYKDIEKIKPYLVLDLHEARAQAKDRDFLGSSLIYTTLDGIDDMFLDMHQATVDGKLCSEPFNFFGPGPIGSINNVVSNTLKIPVITVETYRAYPLERRVDDQLAVMGYILKYNEMV